MNILFPHKVTYLSEDEYESLIIKIFDQIDKEEWDNITFSPYSLYRNNLLFAEEVRSILLMNKSYNNDTERTVIRLFGERRHLIEAKHYKNWVRLRYDINNENIKNLNDSSFLIFINYMYDYIENIGQKGKFDNAKFLIDKGANINIQDDSGCTLLHHFIYKYRTSSVYFSGLKLYVDFIEFLLENGSDIYLADKKGNTPYNIVINEIQLRKDYRFISREKILEIIKNTCIIDTQVRLCEIIYSLMLKYIIKL